MPSHKWSPAQHAKYAATMAMKRSPTPVARLGNEIVGMTVGHKVKAKAGVTFQFNLGDQIITARIVSVNHRRVRMEDLI